MLLLLGGGRHALLAWLVLCSCWVGDLLRVSLICSRRARTDGQAHWDSEVLLGGESWGWLGSLMARSLMESS